MQVNVLTGRLTKSTEGSVGYDLYATEDVLLRAGVPATVSTGVTTKMEGCFALICDRSGLAANWGVSRRGGVIDPDYDKEWKVILCYEGRESYCVRAGDRIAQVLFFPLNDIAVVGEGVEVLSTERTGGLGSTGA